MQLDRAQAELPGECGGAVVLRVDVSHRDPDSHGGFSVLPDDGYVVEGGAVGEGGELEELSR